MKRGAWRNDEKRIPKLQTQGGFRLIRVFSAAHNAHRMVIYARKLERSLKLSKEHSRFYLRLRWRSRNEKAPYQAQQPDTGRGDGNHLLAA